MKALVVTSSTGQVLTVPRHHLVDAFVDNGKVTVSSIKGTKTLLVDEAEQQRVAEQVKRLFDAEDD